MTETYAAWWPVLDDDRAMSELTSEARHDLDDLTADLGRVVTGDVKWSTTEYDGVGLVLLALAPVETVDDHTKPTPKRSGGRPASEVVEDVEWLLEADAGLTPLNVADRLGITTEAVHKALKKAGRADLSVRLTLNNTNRNGHLSHHGKWSA